MTKSFLLTIIPAGTKSFGRHETDSFDETAIALSDTDWTGTTRERATTILQENEQELMFGPLPDLPPSAPTDTSAAVCQNRDSSAPRAVHRPLIQPNSSRLLSWRLGMSALTRFHQNQDSETPRQVQISEQSRAIILLIILNLRHALPHPSASELSVLGIVARRYST
jgi:hypothetical protein